MVAQLKRGSTRYGSCAGWRPGVFDQLIREEEIIPGRAQMWIVKAVCDMCACMAYVVDVDTPSVVATKPSAHVVGPFEPAFVFVLQDNHYYVGISAEIPVRQLG